MGLWGYSGKTIEVEAIEVHITVGIHVHTEADTGGNSSGYSRRGCQSGSVRGVVVRGVRSWGV